MFPPWESGRSADLLFNVQIILGFNPDDLQNSHGDFLKSHSLRGGSNPSSKRFRAPSFSFFESWEVLNGTESSYRRFKRCSCSVTFGQLVTSGLHPVQSVCKYLFQRCLTFPQNRKVSGIFSEIFSQ